MITRKFGLSYKFLSLISLVVVCVTAFLVYFAIAEYRDGMYRQLLTRAVNNLDTTRTRMQNSLWTKTGRLRGVRGKSMAGPLPPELVYHVEKIFSDVIRNDDAVRYFVLHYPGGTLAYPGLPPSKQETLKADWNFVRDIEKYDARYNRKTGYVETFIVIPDKDHHPWAYVEMGVSTQAVESGILRTVRNSVLVAAVSVSLALWVAWHFLGNILGPVNYLRQAASSISAGDLTRRVPVTTNDEIADLGRSFNTMADSLDHRIDDLNAVQAFSKQISASLGREELLRTVTQTFTKVSGATQSAMLSLTKDKRQYFIGSGIGVVDERARIPLDGPLVALAAKTPEPAYLSPPLEASPELKIFFPHGIPVPRTFGVLVLPIVIEQQMDTILILTGENLKSDEDALRLYRTLVSHTAVAIQNSRLYELAITDGLTGLFLRRHFLFELDRVARSNADKMALVMLDIDHFKKINDTYGHPEGDFILISVSETLRETLRIADVRRAERAPDMLGRYGGEEFIALLRNVDREQARIAAERLRKAVEDRTFTGEKNSHHITISLGVSLFRPGVQPDQWISFADTALYTSKTAGRNRVTLHEPA